jgi:hypothetical protein
MSFLASEAGAVVVADDVGHVCLFYAALEGDKVEEALIALRVLRTGHHRKHGAQFLADEDGVLHLALGVAGVHVAALDMDFGRCRVEILELQFANLPAVHGVGVLGVEAGNVELHHAAADFLVRGEPDTDGAVFEFGVLHDVLHGVHDLRHAGFVVGPQKGGAVCGNERLALIMKHFREFLRLQSAGPERPFRSMAPPL